MCLHEGAGWLVRYNSHKALLRSVTLECCLLILLYLEGGMSSQGRNLFQSPTLSSKEVSLERVKVESVGSGGEKMISLS